jgi:DNA-binding transcriptional LysR family regulator
MTLEQLRIFVAVAEQLHVTRAARELNLTQSAASAAIAALEQRYGTALFHRIGRGIQLSDAGRTLLAEAKEVLKHAADAERALAELSGLKRGRLSSMPARPSPITGCRGGSIASAPPIRRSRSISPSAIPRRWPGR